ncbi:MAG: hypothetical protein H0Z33_02570 [Bacillaceae bacterium]|nr:hypothetical protein [Bacillaceae bacterium]
MKSMPVFLSLIVSVTLLFGGWFMYQVYYIEKPIQSYLQSLDGVEMSRVEVNKTQIDVYIDYIRPDIFLEHYMAIEDHLNKLGHGRKVDVHLPEPENELKDVWIDGSFLLQEVIENRKYSRIPEVMKGWQTTYALQQADARMVDEYILIVLKKDNQISYHLLPRHVEEVNV